MRINENQKVTLTLGQLKRLVRESNEDYFIDTSALDEVIELVNKAKSEIAERNQWLKDNSYTPDTEDTDALMEMSAQAKYYIVKLHECVDDLKSLVQELGFTDFEWSDEV